MRPAGPPGIQGIREQEGGTQGDPCRRQSRNRGVGRLRPGRQRRSVKATWESARSRLKDVGVETPTGIPAGGFAGESRRTTGPAWGCGSCLDNRRTGALEDFLRDLVDEGDSLLPHAEESLQVERRNLEHDLAAPPPGKRSSILGWHGRKSLAARTEWRSRPAILGPPVPPRISSSPGSSECSASVPASEQGWGAAGRVRETSEGLTM